jgi:hypothetical protein
MAVNPLIPTQVQQVDVATPLSLLVQSRQVAQDRATADQERQRQAQRQAEQDAMAKARFQQNTDLNKAKIDEFKNSAATKQYIQDTLTVKNLLDSNNPQDAALVIQGMQERFKGTDYTRGLDQDLANITSGNLEPVLSGLNAELQAFEQMGAIGQQTQTQDPAAVREFQFLQSLSPEQRQQFMAIKRANPAINLGGEVVIADPLNPAGAPITTMERTLAPGETPAVRGQQQAAVEAAQTEAIVPRAQAESQAAKIQNRGQRIGALESQEDQNQLLGEMLDQAKDLSGFWTTGFIGGQASRIQGSPAYDLSATLNTLKATAGFDRLQEMRDNSPTGGALGSVTERELELLTSTWGSIEQAQSQEQFERALDRFERQVQRSWDRVNAAYQRDYGEPYFGSGAQPSEDDIFTQADAIINGAAQ